ncbi:MAG: RDD family protein [Planctomycetota bacterium]
MLALDRTAVTTPFAGVAIRAAALALDSVLFCAVFFPITRLAKGVWLMSPADHRWRQGLFIFDPLCLVFLVAILAYYVLLEAAGGTPGKRLLGLRIVGRDGQAPGLRASLIRNVLRVIDSLPAFYLLGAWLVARSPERTRLGDRLAGTRVVRRAGLPHA